MQHNLPHGLNKRISCILFPLFITVILIACAENPNIDRFALVSRHNIENSVIDSLRSLSVGNGEFAFTVDITGLQTFPEYYSRGIALGTMSGWGWHTGRNPDNFKLSDVYKTYEVHGRKIDYVHQFRPYEDQEKASASEWLRSNSHWADIIAKISQLPELNGLYLCSEDTRDSYENPRYLSDHPIVSAVCGMLPETKIADKEVMVSTLDTIMEKWNWQSTWGWDFPMLTMSAASVGKADQALDFLLMDAPENRYLMNGHNYQNIRLPIYLPGNGGLLTAVAKMCVEKQFPENGKWDVKYENLNQYVE